MTTIDRRRVMLAAAAATALPAAGVALVRVDGARLQRTLEELSQFGRPAGGSFADGVSRTAYSDADIAGRAYVLGLMRDAGLNPVIDAAGNIIGRRAGTVKGAKPIIIGSHIELGARRRQFRWRCRFDGGARSVTQPR